MKREPLSVDVDANPPNEDVKEEGVDVGLNSEYPLKEEEFPAEEGLVSTIEIKEEPII